MRRILIIKFVGETKPKEIIIGKSIEGTGGIVEYERPNDLPIVINFNNAEYWWIKEIKEENKK